MCSKTNDLYTMTENIKTKQKAPGMSFPVEGWVSPWFSSGESRVIAQQAIALSVSLFSSSWSLSSVGGFESW